MARVELWAAGQWIRVEFWDHVAYGSVPVKSVSCGRVVKIDRHSFVLSWWEPIDSDEDFVDRNSEKTAAILQSTVIRWGLQGIVWR